MIQGQLQFESVFVVSHILRACSPASNLDKNHNGRLINTSHVLTYWYTHCLCKLIFVFKFLRTKLKLTSYNYWTIAIKTSPTVIESKDHVIRI